MYLIEFYKHPDGRLMYAQAGGDQQELSSSSRKIITGIIKKIKEEYPTTYERLEQIYTGAKLNKSFFEYQIVYHFVSCNFSEFDMLSHDIDVNGNFQLEEVRCPLRGGICPDEGVICKPTPGILTPREIQVLGLMSQGYTAVIIADVLKIAKTTVDNHRKHILTKLGYNSSMMAISYYKTHYAL